MEPTRNAHSVRGDNLPPDFASLVRANGQAAISLAFRKGRCADSYIRFRQWCWKNDVNPSDVFNGIIEPLLHFCENFARRDAEGNVIVSLNLGEVKLEQTYASGHGHFKRKKNIPNKVTLI